MTGLLQKLKSDTRGNVLVIAGAGTMAMVGAAGIGVDTVQWYLWKRQMQQAVDSSALAGALNQSQGAGWKTAAESELKRTANTAYSIVSMTNPPTSGSWKDNTLAVEVVATTTQRLPFSSLFLNAAPSIRVRSVAASINDGENCVYALAPSGKGVDVSGDADLDFGCGVISNSAFNTSVDIGGSSKLRANPISARGGINVGSNDNIDPGTTLIPYGQPVKDPLASRMLQPPASPASCLFNNKTVQPNTSVTLTEGRYCNGLTIRGTVHFDPGVYIIDGGDLKINSQAKITGTDVTFILTGPGSNIATLDISAGAQVDLAAPDSSVDATWANILFYQDPAALTTGNTINGGADILLDGIVYFPMGEMKFNGGSNHDSKCLMLVTYRIEMTGSGKVRNQCSSDYDDYDRAARVIRVVE
ncbi:Tad domain-containing protein [Alteriqipengyuania sp. WL0013]|uniref:TadE/TadG family type IV pilus assembly protein n=1 Tax=Alteriqipengyuania sp. WL0013 TaxID=3110773 RepID=UPI002C2DCA42|nr:Tad domain-containing protein [Alteriqipengyuania sp. WL0013]MEB3414548.1 Tad domain-containing protein [Alteriqipengyuania sp. WL0013]